MNTDRPRPLTRGIHHLGLTVDDISRAQHFFVDVLHFDLVGERAEYPAAFVSDGKTLLSLWQSDDKSVAVPFDRRRNIGLHHVALEILSADALSSLYKRLLTEDGVSFEFGPEPLGNTRACHMICRIPGGPRVEFIAPYRASSEEGAP